MSYSESTIAQENQTIEHSYKLSVFDRENITVWLTECFDCGLTDMPDGREAMAVQLLEALRERGFRPLS